MIKRLVILVDTGQHHPAFESRHDLKSLHFRIAATDPLGKILNAPPEERRDFCGDFGREAARFNVLGPEWMLQSRQ